MKFSDRFPQTDDPFGWFFLILATLVASFVLGTAVGRTVSRQEAVRQGVAEYIDGEFSWGRG